VPVVLLTAALVIVTAVVLVAVGRGGEMSVEHPDYEPLDLGPVSATDVVLLRPPSALWGYSMQATDEAFERIAESIRERDVRIVALEQLVTDLSRNPEPASAATPYPAVGAYPAAAPYPSDGPYEGARHRRGQEAGEASGSGAAASTPPEQAHG